MASSALQIARAPSSRRYSNRCRCITTPWQAWFLALTYMRTHTCVVACCVAMAAVTHDRLRHGRPQPRIIGQADVVVDAAPRVSRASKLSSSSSSTAIALPREEGDEEPLPLALIPEPAEGEVAVVPDWNSFDLGRALRALRSSNVPTVVRQLRILHLRWWHAKSERMHSILEAAGLPKEVLDLIKGVIDTCKVCRLWQRPGRSAVTSSRLSTEFNSVLQVDLLFVGAIIICHICDEATRWSGGSIVKGKGAEHLIPCIINGWFRIWGPPTTRGHYAAMKLQLRFSVGM